VFEVQHCITMAAIPLDAGAGQIRQSSAGIIPGDVAFDPGAQRHAEERRISSPVTLVRGTQALCHAEELQVARGISSSVVVSPESRDSTLAGSE
jgi:hypothetical protein